MKWETGRRSDNVEDRRRGGGGRNIAIGGGGAIIVALIVLLMGGDPSQVLQGLLPDATGTTQGTAQTSPAEDRLADMCSVVLADTEDTWRELFSRMGAAYREPNLVLFTDAVESACGYAQAAVGPFYCPADGKVYLDLGFFRDLRERFGAPGDFAQAYVIAHEVGHHVQNLLKISEKVSSLQRQAGQTESNRLSVKLELQADCLAGVWANHADRARGILEAGDVEEALNAASSIGDDRIQRETSGRVVPDAFTHGTSAQRVGWFRRGLESGDMASCDSFNE